MSYLFWLDWFYFFWVAFWSFSFSWVFCYALYTETCPDIDTDVIPIGGLIIKVDLFSILLVYLLLLYITSVVLITN